VARSTAATARLGSAPSAYGRRRTTPPRADRGGKFGLATTAWTLRAPSLPRTSTTVPSFVRVVGSTTLPARVTARMSALSSRAIVGSVNWKS
jgi:hypothetical protein